MRKKLIDLLSDTVAECMPTECLADIADHLIANGVTIQRWIPVSERLPEEKGTYLICTDQFGIVFAHWYRQTQTASGL